MTEPVECHAACCRQMNSGTQNQMDIKLKTKRFPSVYISNQNMDI